MILLDCEQRSAEWVKARLGIPTASSFEKILTPKTRKPSTQQTGYMYSLLAEWLTGEPADAAVSGFMERGTALEPEAVKWYEWERGVDVQRVGLVLRDDRMVGCSPDGLVGDDGGLEVKCPAASTHVKYLLQGLEGYDAQCQGALWLTGRSWWDLVAYHPTMPSRIVRYSRDEEYIEALDAEMENFLTTLRLSRAALLERGCVPAGASVAMPVGAFHEPEPF